MGADINWVRVYNRLFEIINTEGSTYFSGGRFVIKVREVDPYFPDYTQYINQRKKAGKSTSRRDYFYDIFLELSEDARLKLFHRFLDAVEPHMPEKSRELRSVLGGVVAGPSVEIRPDAWSADRLNDYLREIDDSINAGTHERAVSLSYSCLEGFYKAFARNRIPSASSLSEIIALSKEIKKFIADAYKGYPSEVLNMINHVSYAVDRARNRLSESHFEGEAARWLAVYVRDLVNTQIRLLLHFYGD